MKREIYVYVLSVPINFLLLFVDLENYLKLGYLPTLSRFLSADIYAFKILRKLVERIT